MSNETTLDDVLALVADWRAQAATGGDAHDGPDYDQGVTETLLNCADDLQAAIDAAQEVGK